MSSLMAVSSASLIIPATLYAAMKASNTTDDKKHNILVLSHGTAVILLILYVLYLWFQLRTHSDFFDEENNTQNSNSKQAGQQTGQQTGHRIEQQAEQRIEQQAGQQTEQQVEQRPENDDSEQEEPILTPWAAGAALVVITIGVAVCAEYLVDSIDSIVKTANISKTFIGLILLPIVGNAAEHVTAVVVSLKDKMDLAIGVAIGSSMQIALLVTPFLVLLGWAIDEPMTLQFEVFETVVFFLSVLITNYLIAVSHTVQKWLGNANVKGYRMANRTISRGQCCWGCISSLPWLFTSIRMMRGLVRWCWGCFRGAHKPDLSY